MEQNSQLDFATQAARLKRMYFAGEVHTHFPKMEMQLHPGSCILRSKYAAEFLHAGGGIHGAMLFRMLDDAAFFAAQTLETSWFLQTASFEIRFHAPFTSGELVATANGQQLRGNLYAAEATLTTSAGEKIATGKGRFMPTPRTIEEIANANF